MKKRRGRKRLQLTGQRFNKLEVIGFARMAHGKTTWRCSCDCGTICIIPGDKLKTGHTTSCGCAKKDWLNSGNVNRSHGLSGTAEHRIWKNMRARCNTPSYSDFDLYGGRGIKVCKRWDSFENFLKDMGSRPSDKHTLDRIDPDGDYSLKNCRWSTWQQQRINQRRRDCDNWLPPKDYRPEYWKLTEDEITEIRCLKDTGLTHRELAARFGVCIATISNTLRRAI